MTKHFNFLTSGTFFSSGLHDLPCLYDTGIPAADIDQPGASDFLISTEMAAPEPGTVDMDTGAGGFFSRSQSEYWAMSRTDSLGTGLMEGGESML